MMMKVRYATFFFPTTIKGEERRWRFGDNRGSETIEVHFTSHDERGWIRVEWCPRPQRKRPTDTIDGCEKVSLRLELTIRTRERMDRTRFRP